MQSNANSLVGGSIPAQHFAGCANRPVSFVVPNQTFDPPPPPPPPQKSDIQLQGIEASESKKPLGDRFIGQNNDFTRGWTSNIMPWGMLRKRHLKSGGVYGSAPTLDLTTSLRGDLQLSTARSFQKKTRICLIKCSTSFAGNLQVRVQGCEAHALRYPAIVLRLKPCHIRIRAYLGGALHRHGQSGRVAAGAQALVPPGFSQIIPIHWQALQCGVSLTSPMGGKPRHPGSSCSEMEHNSTIHLQNHTKHRHTHHAAVMYDQQPSRVHAIHIM